MKHAMLRTLALILVLMLVLPGLVLADDDTLALPESGIDMGDMELPEQDGDALQDVELTLEVDGEEGIGITEEEPASILDGGEALEGLIDVPALEDIDDAVEAAPEADAEQADGALADNAAETVSVSYMDARGKSQGPVTCTKVKGGNAAS